MNSWSIEKERLQVYWCRLLVDESSPEHGLQRQATIDDVAAWYKAQTLGDQDKIRAAINGSKLPKTDTCLGDEAAETGWYGLFVKVVQEARGMVSAKEHECALWKDRAEKAEAELQKREGESVDGKLRPTDIDVDLPPDPTEARVVFEHRVRASELYQRAQRDRGDAMMRAEKAEGQLLEAVARAERAEKAEARLRYCDPEVIDGNERTYSRHALLCKLASERDELRLATASVCAWKSLAESLLSKDPSRLAWEEERLKMIEGVVVYLNNKYSGAQADYVGFISPSEPLFKVYAWIKNVIASKCSNGEKLKLIATFVKAMLQALSQAERSECGSDWMARECLCRVQEILEGWVIPVGIHGSQGAFLGSQGGPTGAQG